jgi:hypothetical protein
MSGAPIVIYIHLCQFPNWHLPYSKIIDALKESGLYDRCQEIRLGVVNDQDAIIDEPAFHDPKISTVFYNHCSLYERATLSHMRDKSENENCQYLYLHSKGLKVLNGNDQHAKNCVMDWVDLMIYWNIHQWRLATEKLFKNDIYGCEFFRNPKPHYSGNFWWANSQYIRTLPKEIGNDYLDPEFWICKRHRPLVHNVYSTGLPGGGDLYSHRWQKGINY